ncbi:MAG: DNA-invertase hin [Bacteroidia bacterium]|nr:DNA-invertase hin [Bacteroidia bacterium]
MRTVIYARVSTTNKGQDVDNQLGVLREYCQKMNYELVNEYMDEVSGGTSDRPAFKKMFADASKRKWDLVLFWSLDRFTREGTRATIKYMEQLESYGVGFKSYSEQYIDSCGIFKDVVISLLSTLARQEKVRLGERVRAGLARSTKKSGRPQIDSSMIDEIKNLKQQGISNRKIGKHLNLSHSTVGLYV